MQIFNVKNCPLFGKQGAAYTGLVILPASIIVIALLAIVLFFYKTERLQIIRAHELRLQDLTSHLLATVQKGDDLRAAGDELELFARSTPQNDLFRLHLFWVDRGKIVAGTDRSAIGKSASDLSSMAKNKASVEVRVPAGATSEVMAHEDISQQISALQRKSLWLAALAIFVSGAVVVVLHKMFRMRITKSVHLLQRSISEISPDAEVSQDLSPEFLSLWNSWKQSLERIEPTIHSLIEAERKASFVVLCNSIRHSLARILEDLEPISILPAKTLSASDIRALKEAQQQINRLNQTLESAELEPDPFHLSHRILQTANEPEDVKEPSPERRHL